jgi:ribonuclease BN (tRNA processing enzyme)
VFSSDQNGSNPAFVKFAKGADILIMHLNLPAGSNRLLDFHAPPAVVGRVARDAGTRRLIVSHIGLFDVDAALAELKTFYVGPLTVGADMQCTPVK